MAEFDKELDASGLKCPLPILRGKKAIAEIGPSQVLKIIATDPSAGKDFEAFCKQTGHELLSSEQQEERSIFFIRKRAN